MRPPQEFTVSSGLRILLVDIGVDPDRALGRAGLPKDLFDRERSLLSTEEYFALWRAVEEEAQDPLLALRLGAAVSVEVFDPPISAALCGPDLNTALQRLARYKRLMCPMRMTVDIDPEATTMRLEWLYEGAILPPALLTLAELTFFTRLARIATRTEIKPLVAMAPTLPERMEDYRDYLGVPVTKGRGVTLSFSAADATLPFLTANEGMWRFFESDLAKRLSELEESAPLSARVRGALMEALPGGGASMAEVAQKLRVSARTLQRRLREEGTSFQTLVNDLRAELAKNYLKSSSLSGAEISFLLGYEDPNSFYRAFTTWTGVTPEQARSTLREGDYPHPTTMAGAESAFN